MWSSRVIGTSRYLRDLGSLFSQRRLNKLTKVHVAAIVDLCVTRSAFKYVGIKYAGPDRMIRFLIDCVGNRGVGNLRLTGLVGLGPASRVFTFHLLDSLLTATTNISICPHMTSYFNRLHVWLFMTMLSTMTGCSF